MGWGQERLKGTATEITKVSEFMLIRFGLSSRNPYVNISVVYWRPHPCDLNASFLMSMEHLYYYTGWVKSCFLRHSLNLKISNIAFCEGTHPIMIEIRNYGRNFCALFGVFLRCQIISAFARCIRLINAIILLVNGPNRLHNCIHR